MNNNDPRMVELIKKNRADLAKFGEDKCRKALSIFQDKSSTTAVAEELGVSFGEASDMLQATLRKQIDDSGIDQMMAEKRFLYDCPKPHCTDGKLNPISGTQFLVCDKCESKFTMKLTTKK